MPANSSTAVRNAVSCCGQKTRTAVCSAPTATTSALQSNRKRARASQPQARDSSGRVLWLADAWVYFWYAYSSRQEPVGSNFTASQSDTALESWLNTFALRYNSIFHGVCRVWQLTICGDNGEQAHCGISIPNFPAGAGLNRSRVAGGAQNLLQPGGRRTPHHPARLADLRHVPPRGSVGLASDFKATARR